MQIEAISIHNLMPRGHEVLGELLLGVRASIDLRKSAQLRLRAEDEIGARGGPLLGAGLEVGAFKGLLAGGLPLGAHVEEVDEEIVGELAGGFG